MFDITSTDGEARCGVLTTPSGALHTPAMLVYTHRGSALNLTTPDMLQKLKPELEAVQLDVLQFLNQPSPAVVRGCAGGGRRFLALDGSGCVLVATARDPAVYEYSGALRQSTSDWASVTVPTGAATITPAQYVEAVAALAPDFWVALSDDVPCDSRSDRIAKAVDRTIAWLGACLEAAAGAGAGGSAFAAVQGGQYLNERHRCAQAAAAQPGVAGYAIAGLGTGESPEQRRQILEVVLPQLPPSAPRMVSTLGTPEEVLEAAAQGIDIFDMGYLAQLTATGYALTFPASPEDEAQQQGAAGAAAGAAAGSSSVGAAAVEAAAGAAAGAAAVAAAADCGQDDSKLNLWALAYRADKRPLLPGCGCFACRNHSRAYVHHLLQAHEMTAQVLLEMHNTHHYLRFFKTIRSRIAAGSFAAYRDWFLARRQRWLVGQR